MEEYKVTVVSSENGDWSGIYIDGKLDYEGHSIHEDVWINLIRKYKHFKYIDNFTVTSEYMDDVANLPNLFIAIPFVEIIE